MFLSTIHFYIPILGRNRFIEPAISPPCYLPDGPVTRRFVIRSLWDYIQAWISNCGIHKVNCLKYVCGKIVSSSENMKSTNEAIIKKSRLNAIIYYSKVFVIGQLHAKSKRLHDSTEQPHYIYL